MALGSMFQFESIEVKRIVNSFSVDQEKRVLVEYGDQLSGATAPDTRCVVI
jgi:hypothetical protein